MLPLTACIAFVPAITACHNGLLEPEKIVGKVSIDVQSERAGLWLDVNSRLTAKATGFPTGNLIYQWRWWLDNESEPGVIQIGNKAEIKLSDYKDLPMGARISVVVFSNDYRDAIASDKTFPVINPNNPDPPADLKVRIYGGLDVGSLLESEISCPSDPFFGDVAIYQWTQSSSSDGEYTAIRNATGDTYKTSAGDNGKYIRLFVFHPDYGDSVESNYIGPIGAGTTSRITVTPSSSVIEIGQTVNLAAATVPSGQKVVWSIKDKNGNDSTNVILKNQTDKSVTVDATGTTAADFGHTWTVTAALESDPDEEATASVMVGTVSGIEVKPSNPVIGVGQTMQLNAATLPPNARVVWSSKDENGNDNTNVILKNPTDTSVTVDATGTTSADNGKTWEVKAALESDPDVKDIAYVTVGGATSGIVISPSSSFIDFGKTRQLTVTTLPPGQDVTWSIDGDNENVKLTNQSNTSVDVDAAGTVAADYQKTWKVTAALASGVTDTAEITVDVTPPRIDITPASSPIGIGQAIRLTAKTVPSGEPLDWIIDGGPNDHLKLYSNDVYTIVDAKDATSSDNGETWTVTAKMRSDHSVTGTAEITVGSLKVEVVVGQDGKEVERGGTLQLSAVVYGVINQRVTWSLTGGQSGTTSIDPDTGLLTVGGNQGLGPLTVTATSVVDSTAKGTATVTVVSNDIERVEVSPKVKKIAAGGKLILTAVVYPETKSQDVDWKLYNTTTQKDITNLISKGFDQDGKSTGTIDLASAGSMVSPDDKLTATATSTEDRQRSGTADITVVNAPSGTLQLKVAKTPLAPGEGTQVVADIFPTTPLDITWTVDNPAKASLTGTPGSGTVYLLLTGAAAGETVKVTAQVDTTNLSASAVIRVQDPNTGEITIGWGDFDDNPGNTIGSFTISLTGDGGNPKEIKLNVPFGYDEIRWRHNGEIIQRGADPFVFDSTVHENVVGPHYITCEVLIGSKWWGADVIFNVVW